MMVVLGTDAHKRNHTVVAVDEAGAELGSITVGATPEGHFKLVKWSAAWPDRRWAIEDCRQLSRRLEADLLQLGEQVVRVPPKMMAGVRRSARTRPGSLNRYKTLDQIEQLLTAHTTMVAELGRREVARIRELTREANQLERDIRRRVTQQVPTLLEIPGCGGLTAAKLVGEAADITRFKSRDAYAMWAGVAPIPVWSANNQRFRLNRGGNRQTNAAIHRIAITQIRIHPDAQTFIARRIEGGSTKREALRLLKRKLANVVYRTLLTDAQQPALADAA